MPQAFNDEPAFTPSREYDVIVFDLDGTLSDPLQGIARSVNYALSHFGYETWDIARFAPFVGPPIDKTFEAIVGTTEKSLIEALVAKHRERYSDIGYSENVLYPGIPEAILRLSQAGVPMGVCTSKRRDFAERILKMFDLFDAFRFVDGGDIGIHKWQQLANLRAQGTVTTASLMIGDRAVDITAAHKNGMRAGGVLWGYGDRAELESERPKHLFQAPPELSQLG